MYRMIKGVVALSFGTALWLTVPLSLMPARADGPRAVKNAVLQVVTGDDGKDDTDVFTVVVQNAGGKILERVFDAKEEIKPFTTFNLWLNKVRAVPPDQVKGSKVTFQINTKWDEHWVVKDARLTVNYDSGTPDKWHWGPFALQTKGANQYAVEFPLDDDHKL
jgi:hypothetical protein